MSAASSLIYSSEIYIIIANEIFASPAHILIFFAFLFHIKQLYTEIRRCCKQSPYRLTGPRSSKHALKICYAVVHEINSFRKLTPAPYAAEHDIAHTPRGPNTKRQGQGKRQSVRERPTVAGVCSFINL